jgi:hypothetical protein
MELFWGEIHLTLQKKIVGAKPQTPCRDLFKKLQLLPLPCKYIFSLLNFVINNLEHFQTNSAIYGVNTRNKYHLHRSTGNLICFQKSTYDSSIKMFNNLPPTLRSLMNGKEKFKIALKQYLNAHSFYSADEFLLPKTESAS